MCENCESIFQNLVLLIENYQVFFLNNIIKRSMINIFQVLMNFTYDMHQEKLTTLLTEGKGMLPMAATVSGSLFFYA